MSDTYLQLETSRSQYRDNMPVRDGFSAEQQIAIATLHNQSVSGGSCMAIAVLLPKATRRALARKGVIDSRCCLTKAGDDILRKWWKEARKCT